MLCKGGDSSETRGKGNPKIFGKELTTKSRENWISSSFQVLPWDSLTVPMIHATQVRSILRLSMVPSHKWQDLSDDFIDDLVVLLGC